MNLLQIFRVTICLFSIMNLLPVKNFSQAPVPTCTFADPIVNIDFGSGGNSFNPTSFKSYEKVNHNCPDDGHYSISTESGNCFGGNWHTVSSDHTPGDWQGKMMIVNASQQPGPFFIVNIAGLKPGATYQLGVWLLNICLTGYGCNPTPPVLSFNVLSNGIVIKKMATGQLLPTAQPQWRQHNGSFEMPANASSISLQIEDLTEGGCGNDFAIDDISLRECIYPPAPIQKVKIVKAVAKPEVKKPAVVKNTPAPKPVAIQQKRVEAVEVPTATPTKTVKITGAPNKPINKNIPLPAAIAKRANPVVREIATEAGELSIELYDNGQVDGDTVSIYHNNKLLLSRAGLSEKPLKFKIMVDANQPHHELIMVAENLGSIPPNTSLMIVTSASSRHEVFISSSEIKNAKIVIDLKQ